MEIGPKDWVALGGHGAKATCTLLYETPAERARCVADTLQSLRIATMKAQTEAADLQKRSFPEKQGDDDDAGNAIERGSDDECGDDDASLSRIGDVRDFVQELQRGSAREPSRRSPRGGGGGDGGDDDDDEAADDDDDDRDDDEDKRTAGDDGGSNNGSGNGSDDDVSSDDDGPPKKKKQQQPKGTPLHVYVRQSLGQGPRGWIAPRQKGDGKDQHYDLTLSKEEHSGRVGSKMGTYQDVINAVGLDYTPTHAAFIAPPRTSKEVRGLVSAAKFDKKIAKIFQLGSGEKGLIFAVTPPPPPAAAARSKRPSSNEAVSIDDDDDASSDDETAPAPKPAVANAANTKGGGSNDGRAVKRAKQREDSQKVSKFSAFLISLRGHSGWLHATGGHFFPPGVGNRLGAELVEDGDHATGELAEGLAGCFEQILGRWKLTPNWKGIVEDLTMGGTQFGFFEEVRTHMVHALTRG